LIVIDASALLELLQVTEKGVRIYRRIMQTKTDLHAPHLIDLEVAQVLRKLVTLGFMEKARAEEALLDMASLEIHRHSHSAMLSRIWDLRHNLTAYDAAYVVLAEVLEAPLLTCDRGMSVAAGTAVQIELF
jgi:predicted nucleic acid-binding protein